MDSLEKGLKEIGEAIAEWLPQLLGALVIVLIGHWVAKMLCKAVGYGLNSIELDRRLSSGQGGNVLQRAVPSPTHLLVRITYWLVFIGAVSLGATVLGIDALNRFVAAVYGYIPQVIAALIIFLVGSAIAATVTTLVRNTMGDTPTGKMIESLAPVIVIGVTTFAILDQLDIAPAIVTITYAALIGSVAFGTALAFGLGGRDVAARILEAGYERGAEKVAQAKVDLRKGKQRAKAQVRSRK